MKSVDVEFRPTKLCVYRDELWAGGWNKGVFVYNKDLQLIKQIKNKHFNWVTSVLKTDTDVVVCDDQTGLHILNQQGDYLKQICSGQFSDVSVANNTLFGLEYVKQQVHVYNKSHNGWAKERELNLSGYSEGFHDDKLFATSTCIYVSSYKTHCVRIYSLKGNFLYKTGEWSPALETGQFDNPVLSDVDSGGKVLLCDLNNHRLQVFDPKNRQWAEIRGLEALESPSCAGLGHKHLWVGSVLPNQLFKYEAHQQSLKKNYLTDARPTPHPQKVSQFFKPPSSLYSSKFLEFLG